MANRTPQAHVNIHSNDNDANARECPLLIERLKLLVNIHSCYKDASPREKFMATITTQVHVSTFGCDNDANMGENPWHSPTALPTKESLPSTAARLSTALPSTVLGFPFLLLQVCEVSGYVAFWPQQKQIISPRFAYLDDACLRSTKAVSFSTWSTSASALSL
ncbi:hypothetical protein PoB_003075700 [Plakobranchus ocellatus]|uniref:Uncharacterized protein n=1 Tax=Plakobranchus ocellatus TaxID=259542 RepID=A0AAV4AAI5_9GAST|nr:hypothetical protein PoB_003075700 [Plakobranchus ocellatus]